MTPTIVVLNGTSSCGKTSIARAFQLLMAGAAEPYIYLSIDAFWEMLPERYFDDEPTLVTAQTGFFRCIRALASAGNNVIVDALLATEQRKAEVAALLHQQCAFFVGVQCSLDVIEQRERARGDRPIGQARAQFDRVHAHGIYDLLVDSALSTPEECALLIKHHLESATGPHAFQRLHRYYSHRTSRTRTNAPSPKRRTQGAKPTRP